MKKKLFSIFSILPFLGFAQKPVAGDHQMSFGLQKYQGVITFKKYKTDMLVRRYSLGGYLSLNNNGPLVPDNYYNEFSGYYYYSSLQSTRGISNYFVFMNYGLQKNYAGFEKFEPYCGIDFQLNNTFAYSKERIELMHSSGSYGSQLKTVGDYSERISKSNYNLGLSLNPFIGFNYYLNKDFALGAEFEIPIVGAKYGWGGEVVIKERIDGIDTSEKQKTPNHFAAGMNFSGNGMITATYKLH